ncbi:hypothetical protein CPB83DRAFT_899705 [Crepidotus variabilis]|uniref:Uncharacterized protein n=1 Tax=Crepidotus variabilis TaxID=179855 RepID=A0A9P6JIJ5_9AGAR|nr:hypothetical protein CPB83DRAFT_899705 [Crepidotus variabilis]
MPSPLLLSELATAETARLASYLKESFLAALENGKVAEIPASMDIDDLLSCDWCAELLAEAMRNIYRTTWSVKDYRDYIRKVSPCSTGRNKTFERKLLRKFPPIYKSTLRLTRPAMVVDKDGRILVCYLPRLIKREHRLPIWKNIAIMEKHMDIRRTTGSWRTDANNYLPPSRCRISPGTFSIAPFWYQQAHSTVDKLEVSAKMRSLEGLAWIKETQRISSLLGALLSVVHPSQYHAGMDCIDRVAANPELVDK